MDVREVSCYTDSAAAATAMACGVKTYNGAIGVDINGNAVPNALELAEQKGKATGVVTSVEWTHATPAGFVAHNVSRNNYAAIGKEMVNVSAADVVMGAGHPWYDARRRPERLHPTPTGTSAARRPGMPWWPGRPAATRTATAVADPWTLIQTRAEFQALMSGPTPERVLGNSAGV